MVNDGRRWLGIVAFFMGSILWLVPWIDPIGWSQDLPSSTEANPSLSDEERPADETPTPSEEILAPLEEAPPSAPGTLAIPTPETPTGVKKYTVKSGDTLWDISNAFLRDSFLWPKLWKNNQYILNPDLIFPGDIIELPGRETSQQAALVETTPPAPTTPPRAAEKETPMEVEKAVETEIHIETSPAPTVKPFDQALLAASGYILVGQRATGIVVGARDGRELIGQDETAYLLPQDGSQPQVGDRFSLYRIVRKVYHPKTGKYIGDLIRILGLAEIIGANPREKTVSAKVLVSYDSIQKGDSLMPMQAQEASSDQTARPEPADNPLEGFIVEVKENRVSQSQFDVVYLDRGQHDGVRSGDRFTVIRKGDKTPFFSPGKGVQLPQRIIGELQVISVQDATSTAQVLQSTEVIFKGDRFETHSKR